MVRSLLLWTPTFAAALLVGSSCGVKEQCVPGYEGCPCANETCLDGLVCLSSYCVDPDWTPPGDDAAATHGDASEDGGQGSGHGSPDNVAACNALVEELGVCGDFDLTSVVDCSVFVDYTCDISDYFDCIREAFMCVDEVPDTTGFPGCVELATCT